ncbi:MAG TPA: hypothetical protein VIL18_12915 [Longimicrobiales bacterium]
MRLKVAVVSAMVLAAVAAPAAAQQAGSENALQKGRRSISFGLPGGGGTSFGIWTMLSQRTNLGLNVELDMRDSDTPDVGSWELELAPAIKRYTRGLGPVTPFLYGEVSLGFAESSQGANDLSSWSTGAFGGLGVEWFPVRSVSIGGYTGIGLSYMSSEVETPGLPSDSRTDFRLSTGTSALSLHIYFGGPSGGEVASGK